MIEHPPSSSSEFPGPSVLARSVSMDFDVVGVVYGGSLTFVDVASPLDLGGRIQMRVGHVNIVSAFQHASVTRNNATLLESVVLHEAANGSRTKFGLVVKGGRDFC